MVLRSARRGNRERELGTALAKAFLYACTENEDRPSKMVFMNSGVRLVTENDETLAHVKRLEDGGVEILVCGTCLGLGRTSRWAG